MSFYPSIGPRGFSHHGFVSFPNLSAFLPNWNFETLEDGPIRIPALARVEDWHEHFLLTTYCYDNVSRIGGQFACFIDCDSVIGMCKPPSTACKPDGLLKGSYSECEARTWIQAAGIVHHLETGEPMHGFYFDFTTINSHIGIVAPWSELQEAAE